ncbi:MAG TPA: Gfo/Idh/MocA family oxidoreductase [Xanthobacteraceae bacterium]|nr:Gfo/Idh/MocA family oxidoreductase [Xanthobacteraceae bacterium]
MNAQVLTVGIAGYGVVGKRRREFIDKHPALRTVAVCDRTFGGSGTLPDGVPYFATYHELLGQPLDILFICMTNDIAAEVTIAGLQRGLHVFCEKPPGRTVADVNAVKAEWQRHPGLQLKYGFNHRYHDSVRDALALMHSGKLGRVLNLRGVYGKSQIVSYGSKSIWRTQREVAGGGILLDQGIHMVDLIRLFGGEFEEVYSFVSNDYWGYDVEDNAAALMRSKTGVVALLHSTATQWRHRFSLDVTLEKGALILSGILSGSKSYGAETLTVVWAAADDLGDPMEQVTRYNRDPSWDDEIREFADCILAGKPVINGSVDEALRTMELVYRIYAADKQWSDRWGIAPP